MTSTRSTGIHTVGIPVADQDRALACYTADLGLEVRIDVEQGAGMRWIEVAAPGAQTSIALILADRGDPAGRPTGIRLTTTDAEALHRQLAAAGLDVDEVLRWPGVPLMFTFRDLDGNGLVAIEEIREG